MIDLTEEIRLLEEAVEQLEGEEGRTDNQSSPVKANIRIVLKRL